MKKLLGSALLCAGMILSITACQKGDIPKPKDGFITVTGESLTGGQLPIVRAMVYEPMIDDYIEMELETGSGNRVGICIGEKHLSEKVNLSKYDSLKDVVSRSYYLMYEENHIEYGLAHGSDDWDLSEMLCEKGSYIQVNKTGNGTFDVELSLKSNKGIKASAMYSGLFLPKAYLYSHSLVLDGKETKITGGSYLGKNNDEDPYMITLEMEDGSSISFVLDGSDTNKTIDLSKLDPLDGSGKQLYYIYYTPKGGSAITLAYGGSGSTCKLCSPGSTLIIGKSYVNGAVNASVELILANDEHRAAISTYGRKLSLLL